MGKRGPQRADSGRPITPRELEVILGKRYRGLKGARLADAIANDVCVSRRTAYNWLDGTTVCEGTAAKLLRVLAFGRRLRPHDACRSMGSVETSAV